MRVLYDASLIRMMLAQHGVEVTQASSADDAMAVLAREQPHVVVTTWPCPAATATTCWRSAPTAAGFHAFLRKPVESHELAAALARAAASVSAASS